MAAIRSRLAASSLLASASSCAIRSLMIAIRSMRYRCYQSQSRPHQCSTHLDPRIGHACDDERLDEKNAHTHTQKTRSDGSDDPGFLTVKKSKGAVGDVEWGDAAKFRP